MIRTEIKDTDFGKIDVTFVICDSCGKKAIKHPDNISGWFDLNVFYGNLDLTGDFCSIKCLTYFVTEVLPGKSHRRLALNE